MKKVLALAFVAISFLTSCSSDETVSVTDEKLKRKWYFRSYQSQGETVQYVHQNCVKDYFELLSDGVFTNNYVTSCGPLIYFTSTGSWTVSGDLITTNESGESKTGKITKLSDTNLQITYQGDFDEDGEEETMKVNYTIN